MAKKVKQKRRAGGKAKLRCFISAAAGTNISAVVRVLKKHEIEVVDSVPPAGAEPLSSISKLFGQADFVLGVIGDERGSASTLFEIGLAIGIGKPVGTVVAPSISIPTTLRGFFSVFAEPSDEEALEFNIPIFLKTIRSSSPKNVIKSQMPSHATARIGPRDSSQSTSTSQEHSLVEQEIAEALRGFAGASIVERSPKPGQADFVAWIPSLQSDFGNPVVFEAKSTIAAVDTDVLRNQMARFFSIPGLKTVIVAHPDEDHARMQFTGDGYLFVFGLSELKRVLANDELNEMLVALRNKAAHGDY